MVFRSTSVALALFAVVGALRRRANNAQESEAGDSADVLTYDAENGGVDDVNCGGGMLVEHVGVPWRKTDSRVNGAGSSSECEDCARDLERRDILQPNWKCERTLFSRAWHIRRDAENTPRDGVPATRSFNLTEADAQGKPLPLPIGTSPLPSALHGIFWLTDQNTSSAIATFAGRVATSNEPEDCKWCSKGGLTLNGLRLMPTGNCHWAFATLGEGRDILGTTISGYGLALGLQLVYDFIFDDAVDPSSAKIKPVGNVFGSEFGQFLADQHWLADFTMAKLSPEEAARTGYPGSVIWRRATSALFGSQDLFPYDLVQIVDGSGNRIQPAWDAFVKFQQSEVAGTSPGIIHYHGDC